jgi:tRNA modification GTPase
LAGTSVDYLIGELEIEGLRVQFIDTAGLEQAAELQAGVEPSIQQSMQRHTERMREEADLVLVCVDTTRGLSSYDADLLQSIDPERGIVVGTKLDAADARPLELAYLGTSAASGEGLESLRILLRQSALRLRMTHSQMVPGTAARCRDSLAGALSIVSGAKVELGADTGEELIASDLRAALDHLAQVVGAVYTDHILDVIFSRFCIGK